MKKSFTMIEIVFVIVIIGILVAMALPRLASVTDDALAAKEKAAIAGARESIRSLSGYKMLHPGISEKNITVVHIDGSTYQCKVFFSKQNHPLSISVKATSGVTDNNNTQPTHLGDGRALAPLYLEPHILVDWNSSGLSGNIERLTGPATNTVISENAALKIGQYWEYNNENGRLVLK